MKICDIKKYKKHQTLILLDDGREIALDNDLFLEEAIYKDMELSIERLKELKEKSEYLRAKSRALWLLDRCLYSERTLYSKLTEAGFSGKISAKVIARLKELSLLDDELYAHRLCEYLAEKHYSKNEIRHKLYEKGIDKELIELSLCNTEINEYAAIRAIIDKKHKDKLLDRQGFDKTYAALCRRGFPFSAVREVLKQYREDIIYLDGE